MKENWTKEESRELEGVGGKEERELSKHMKRYPTLLTIKDIQIKTFPPFKAGKDPKAH